MKDVFEVWPGLRSVFPDGDVLFVSDQQYVVDLMAARGLPSEHLAEISEPPGSVVLVGCDYTSLGPREALHDLFAASRVLWVPLVSFDPHPEAAAYSLGLLLASDLEASTKGNRDWTSVLRRARRPLSVSSDRTSLTFRVVRDDIVVVTRLQPLLDVGEFVSVAEYFEVDIDSSLDVGTGGDDRADADDRTGTSTGSASYTADGTFWADGLCVARHPQLDFDAPVLRRAREIAARVAEAGGMLVRVEDCRIVSAVCGDTDWAQDLARCAGESGARLVEFSFGTNHAILDTLDWSVNSQINEGAGGVHIGVGDGVSGAHIDFVLPAARVALAAA
ncbi:hypothetical protein [Streptomyces apricus]|uniref:Crocagin biosynthetic protein CgnE/B domain-containing protein n=1 Tax=Streptomyces apricus TaxID=1828112 RepID=A0A5B0BLC7_9ACTN|nr:hypothetical protein [Streptomyces apricus]KAA0942720.1 hypothetical protein FGF04_02400 [Streptomyces apricus]